MSKPTRYVSSDFKETTTQPYQELIPEKPTNWTIGYTFKKVAFINECDCIVIINNNDAIKLSAGRGFSSDYDDPPISSFVIVEEDVAFELIATY